MNQLFIATILCLSISTNLSYGRALSPSERLSLKRSAETASIPCAPVTLKSLLLANSLNITKIIRLGVVPTHLTVGSCMEGKTDHLFDPMHTSPEELEAMTENAKVFCLLCDAETRRLNILDLILTRTFHDDWTDSQIIGFIFCFLYNFVLDYSKNLDAIKDKQQIRELCYQPKKSLFNLEKHFRDTQKSLK